MSSSTGNAGEYLVMAELLLRDFDAYLAGRENPAFDIACFANPSRRATRLRVKTTTDGRAKWSAKPDGSIFRDLGKGDDFVVIANIRVTAGTREFYVVPTKIVETALRTDFEFYISCVGPSGKARKTDSKARFITFDGDERPHDRGYGYAKKFCSYLDAWNLLK